MSRRKGKSRHLCHDWKIGDAKEAYKALRIEHIRDLGQDVSLEDGTVLHINYDGQDDYGCRRLSRCLTCGGLILSQSSMDCWDPTDIDMDCFYMPVRSPEEAGLLNILLDYNGFIGYPRRILNAFNNSVCSWMGSGEPAWADPEELKEKIRRKYAGLSPEEKELLEKLMRDAGKKETE